MDDGALSVRPQVLVAAYLLVRAVPAHPARRRRLAVRGTVLWRRGLRTHGAAVVGLGIACMVLGVTALR
jgi:hypothetical protein